MLDRRIPPNSIIRSPNGDGNDFCILLRSSWNGDDERLCLRRERRGGGDDGSGGEAVDGAAYPYPVLIAMAQTDGDLAYNMTKAMVELFPAYQDKVPGISGWHLDRQNFEWVVPYHEGAIRYYQEQGLWTDAAQAHNDNLIARQEALQAAWEALKAESPDDWDAAWAEARKKALADGGFSVVF